jgi:UDP-N-acetylmuramoyl-tripeptide--D-alanyl-D-alanine ligase
VITNAYPAHLASMGSVAAVACAKGELFMRLAKGGWAVYNADDSLIAAAPSPGGVHRIGFGLGDTTVSAFGITSEGRRGMSFTMRLPSGETHVTIKAFGLHNVANALAAAAAAVALGVGIEIIRAGLEECPPVDKRFNLEELDGVVLIDDSYNANPASMAAALTTLRDIKKECRGFAALGDMLELGPGSADAHRSLGRLAASCVEELYLLGEMAEVIAAGAVAGGMPAVDVHVLTGHDELLDSLPGRLGHGEYLLVKGSRGTRMEIVAEGIRQAFAPQRAKGTVA